ncbi:MAG: superoxide dismutase family protein [Chthoniobacterales bacterium]
MQTYPFPQPAIFKKILLAGCLSAFCLTAVSLRADDVKELIAVLQPTEGNKAAGTVIFKDLGNGKVDVTAHVTGLEPNSKHGFHIHEFGDITAKDGMSTGSHFNPDHHDHALPAQETRHAGDFGNLEANAEGVADMHLVVDNIVLTGAAKDAIIGRGVIVHLKLDDGSQPVGNAGARIADGVIGVKNTTPPKK